MVIKESLESDSFWNPREWRDRVPREIKIHQLIEEGRNNQGTGFDYLLRFRTYRLIMRKKRARIYLDFLPGGDLGKAFQTYWKYYVERKPEDREPEGRNYFYHPAVASWEEKGEYLPEEFLWEAFRDLVHGCLAMQQGDVRNPQQGWRPLTHLDINYTNVMLHIDENYDQDQERFNNQWPRLVIGDFGLSFYDIVATKGLDTSDNPQCYQNVNAADLFRYAPVWAT